MWCFVLFVQISWSAPAFAVTELLAIITSSKPSQISPVIVHLYVFKPSCISVTVVTAWVSSAKVPEPKKEKLEVDTMFL